MRQKVCSCGGTLDKLRNMYSDEISELYLCITWCGLGFYDVDFGWGKPIWVIKPVEDKISTMYPNVIALMDSNSGDGIEAMMFLPETHMAKLLCDAEFLSFVSINPTISVPSAPN
ncbi:BAHD acyltransferase [Camellia lanceoleosa]|uniref:BAHD acyltransferase n=1 Tax=Camellia lanceoleosa TaxID=1840588 RepID=A0ACC0GT85_9ERIC|nr:BAHD acyltransferase [Camellia lanceoleosa]